MKMPKKARNWTKTTLEDRDEAFVWRTSNIKYADCAVIRIDSCGKMRVAKWNSEKEHYYHGKYTSKRFEDVAKTRPDLKSFLGSLAYYHFKNI